MRSMGRTFARLAEWEVSELAVSVARAGRGRGRPGPARGARGQPRAGHRGHPELRLAPPRRPRRRPAAPAPARATTGPRPRSASPTSSASRGSSRRRGSRRALADGRELRGRSRRLIVTEHGGRVIKTIGDEILFVADDPAGDGADRAGPRRGADADFPELRVGVAYGGVLARLGDVFGPVVNIAVAAHLAGAARPDPRRPGAERGPRRATRSSASGAAAPRPSAATPGSRPAR